MFRSAKLVEAGSIASQKASVASCALSPSTPMHKTMADDDGITVLLAAVIVPGAGEPRKINPCNLDQNRISRREVVDYHFLGVGVWRRVSFSDCIRDQGDTESLEGKWA